MYKSIFYISETSPLFEDKHLLQILNASLNKNNEKNISGFLLFNKNKFLQLIEGEIKSIDLLFSKIRKDKRHQNIIILEEKNIPNVLFPYWIMSVSTDKNKNINSDLFFDTEIISIIQNNILDDLKQIFIDFL